MRAVLLVITAVLSSCRETTSTNADDPCDENVCTLPDLDLAAEVHPSAKESDLVACEFPPGTYETTGRGLQITLGEAATVELNVFEEGSQTPIPASIIFTRPSLIPGRAPVSYAIDTDAEGRATVSLLPLDPMQATYSLHVTPDAPTDRLYPPLTLRDVAIEGSRTLDVSFSAVETLLALSGRIERALSTDQAPYEAMRVRGVVTADQSLTSLGTVDTKTGHFIVYIQPFSGPFRIEVAPPEGIAGPTFWYDAEVPKERLSPIDYVLIAPDVPNVREFCVTARGPDASGAQTTAVGAQVVFSADLADVIVGDGADGPGPDGASFRASAITDAQGLATLSLLPGLQVNTRLYTVAILPAPGSALAARTWESFPVPAATDVTNSSCHSLDLAALDLRPTIGGFVVAMQEDGSQRIIKGATLEAVRLTDLSLPSADTVEILPSPPSNPQATTDPAGNFLLGVDPGTYDLECIPAPEASWPRWWRGPVEVKSDVTDADIVLPRAVTSEITILRPNGNPISGAAVRLFLVLNNSDHVRVTGEGTSDALGRAFVVLPNP